MARNVDEEGPQCHVLQFLHNKDDACAVTVLCNGVRFHVAADVQCLQDRSVNGKKVFSEYKRLLRNLKQAEGAADAESESDETDSSSNKGDSDSGVDVSGPQDQDGGSAEQVNDAELALQNWMLSPFAHVMAEKAPVSKTPKQQSLQGWYDCETFYYNLQLKGGELQAVEQDESDALKKRIDDLTPNLLLPKYILQLDIPWFIPTNVTVLDASDDPAPYHPCRVSVDNKTYFVKLVDMTQPQPTKREITHLKHIEKLGLHKQMRVPLIEGLVGYGTSKNRIMGFLMTDIEGATSLVKKLDLAVPQKHREKWAKEAERMRDLLHENDVVWGDAKADNFVVDKDEKLWMIDFGGSYTEGWVDAELQETEEGDDMGVERISNALRDPEKNTYDPDGEDTGSSEGKRTSAGKKRKRDHGEDKAVTSSKLSRKSTVSGRSGVGEASYCYCGGAESGNMIACDNKGCGREWFHFECVGVKKAPQLQWFCENCKAH